MPTATLPDSLYGKTLRWTFKDGPTKDMTFEHTFKDDGSVTWRSAGPDAKDHRESASAAVKVSDDVHLVSYLSRESGYTITVALTWIPAKPPASPPMAKSGCSSRARLKCLTTTAEKRRR